MKYWPDIKSSTNRGESPALLEGTQEKPFFPVLHQKNGQNRTCRQGGDQRPCATHRLPRGQTDSQQETRQRTNAPHQSGMQELSHQKPIRGSVAGRGCPGGRSPCETHHRAWQYSPKNRADIGLVIYRFAWLSHSLKRERYLAMPCCSGLCQKPVPMRGYAGAARARAGHSPEEEAVMAI